MKKRPSAARSKSPHTTLASTSHSFRGRKSAPPSPTAMSSAATCDGSAIPTSVRSAPRASRSAVAIRRQFLSSVPDQGCRCSSCRAKLTTLERASLRWDYPSPTPTLRATACTRVPPRPGRQARARRLCRRPRRADAVGPRLRARAAPAPRKRGARIARARDDAGGERHEYRPALPVRGYLRCSRRRRAGEEPRRSSAAAMERATTACRAGQRQRQPPPPAGARGDGLRRAPAASRQTRPSRRRRRRRVL